MNAEDVNEFIEFFRRFINAKNEWGILDADIYNIDELESAIGLE
jgi:hypothetical protein